MSKRVFETGAYRNPDDTKLDYEGFFSPMVMEQFAKYMQKHRKMEDGTFRDSDNWQKGIPTESYMKSMFRHFMSVWKNYRGFETEESQLDNLSALMFNVMGYMFNVLEGKSLLKNFLEVPVRQDFKQTIEKDKPKSK